MNSETFVLENQIDGSVSITNQHEENLTDDGDNAGIVAQTDEFAEEISSRSGSKSNKGYFIFVCFTIIIIITGSLIVYYKSPGPPGIFFNFLFILT